MEGSLKSVFIAHLELVRKLVPHIGAGMGEELPGLSMGEELGQALSQDDSSPVQGCALWSACQRKGSEREYGGVRRLHGSWADTS